jgi:predicted porin
LEKIEMKKTLVAIAAMAAVTGAMADATIYGTLEQTYTSGSTSTDGVLSSKTTSIGEYQMGTSLIGFKGSEDLGSGMKASYLYEMGMNLQTSATAPLNRQAYVGLSGGFGALRIGKQYSSSFNNLVSADPGGATSAPGALWVAVNVSNNGSESPLRQDSGIQYDLPTIASGLKITLTKVVAGHDTSDAGSKVGDSQGYALNYASGPLNVGYTADSTKSQNIMFGTATTVVTAVDGTSTKQNTLAAGYDLGMAKVSYSDAKVMNNGAGIKASMFALSAPVGGANLFVSSSTGKIITTSESKLKGMQYGFNYALSKRTVAYYHAGKTTVTTSSNSQTSIKGYGIGIHHSF